jgi:hypothetical protein
MSVLISILISISKAELRFRHRNFDSDIGILISVPIGFKYQSRNVKAFLTKIIQNFYLDCLSKFEIPIITFYKFDQYR